MRCSAGDLWLHYGKQYETVMSKARCVLPSKADCRQRYKPVIPRSFCSVSSLGLKHREAFIGRTWESIGDGNERRHVATNWVTVVWPLLTLPLMGLLTGDDCADSNRFAGRLSKFPALAFGGPLMRPVFFLLQVTAVETTTMSH